MPEMIHDLPFHSYLNDPGFGSSDLHMMRAGVPAVVKWRRENRNHNTRFTGIGKAAHCRVLTPELFAKDFYVRAEGEEFRSKEARAARDAMLDMGKTILSYDDGEIVREVHAAICSNQAAAESLQNSVGREVSCFWECEHSGLPSKCRPDSWTRLNGELMVVDIKVTVEATKPLDRVLKAATWNGWINQLAHNRAGLRAVGQDVKRGGLLLVPNSAPFSERIRLLTWNSDALDEVEQMNVDTRRLIKACVDEDRWPTASASGWEEQQLPENFIWTELSDEQLDGAEVM